MACFVVPAAEALAVTAVNAVLKKHDCKKAAEQGITLAEYNEQHSERFSRKLSWLSGLLWGGAALLCFEHIWHGEVVPWAPFLTAASSPETTAIMLKEMSVVGTSMAAVVTAVWGVAVWAVKKIAHRGETEEA